MSKWIELINNSDEQEMQTIHRSYHGGADVLFYSRRSTSCCCTCTRSVYYRWVGGGDMNGIVLLLSESMVSIVAAVIAIVNSILVWKVLYSNYKKAFHNVD